MSEQTPTISGLVTELFPKYLDPECFAIVNGGISETSALLEHKWDHSKPHSYNMYRMLLIPIHPTVVFTGSTAVGKIVSAAAAKHLTPVTLEVWFPQSFPSLY
jgi:aldehyde dehydrogenase (NAD+)